MSGERSAGFAVRGETVTVEVTSGRKRLAMVADGFLWIVRHPALSHSLIALVLMGVLGPALRALSVRGFAWHAAAYTSLYFYARETAQAERALRWTLGDPGAYFWTLWPGNWEPGGHLIEWLAPTAVAAVLALTVPIDPRGRRAPPSAGTD